MAMTLRKEAVRWSNTGEIKRKRVLVIDDQPEVRTIVQYSLEDIAGWDISLAGSGEEGLTHVIAGSFDGIVLDVNMPTMNGLTFLKQLRARLDLPFIPVVLLTAEVNLSQDPLFNELGIAGVIAKPFDPLLISKQISSFLSWDI
jgi:CheY-like chemotaxis protein